MTTPPGRSRDPFRTPRGSTDAAAEVDHDALVRRTDWLRERHDRLEARHVGLSGAVSAVVSRSAAVTVAVASLVLLTLPWWDGLGGDEDASGGPWALLSLIFDTDPVPVGLVVAVLPLLAYLAAAFLLLVAGLGGGSRRVAWTAFGTTLVALVASLLQAGVLAGVGPHAEDTDLTSAAVTAWLVWVVGAVAAFRVAEDA